MTDKIKILHCADLHLCSELAFLKSKAKSRRLEILNTLQNIVTLCKEQSVELLIIAGDLFDSNHIDSGTLSAVKKMFASIPGTTVAIAAGNHDYYAVDSPYSDDDWSKNVIVFYSHFSKIELPEKNLRLCGSSFVCSYQEKSDTEIYVKDDKMINILVYHGDVVTENQNSRYNPITVKQIETSGFDYVALGHIHSASAVMKAGNVSYAYCGTPDGNGFDETGKKGVYMGTVSKHRTDLKFYETSSRTFEKITFDISSITSNSGIICSVTETLEKKYGEKYKENLYHITLTGKTPEGFTPSVKKITQELSENLYYVAIANDTKPDIDIQTLAADFSLKGIFVKKMLGKINACTSEEEKSVLEDALYIGLKAFDGEVSFYEDQ